ncbi:late control protein [Aurantimonas phage AmM-1]|uniref:tail protein n=1 Tax=Aurantimonas phage AmM-1 TaxID=1503929 RepID=UPI000540DC0B|nr:tail protein [Aurantimonas phage AmM-1]BAP94484.1 late control protein [Aurantimonas phage AmM-1]
MTWRVHWQVLIDGRNVSIGMRPYLISIEIVDKDGSSADTCRLVFDDSRGQLLLPRVGARVDVRLQGASAFTGVVDSTPWRLSRGGGRILEVSAKGFDTRSKVKSGKVQMWHLDDATLDDALQKASRAAGLSGMVVDPQLGALKRDYWSPDGANFLAWGERLARELGATFKIRGDQAVFAKRGAGLAATGAAMPTVQGRCGVAGNVITAQIDPSKGRARFKSKTVRYFDRPSASFKELSVEIEGAGDAVEAEALQRWTAADEGQAQDMANGQKVDAERDAGVGSVQLTLAVGAQAEGSFVLTGARPGIDGAYRITGVTHRADRNGGATTDLALAQPQGDAGKDQRGTSSRAGSVPVPTPAPR